MDTGTEDVEHTLGIGAAAPPWWRRWSTMALFAVAVAAAAGFYLWFAGDGASNRTQYRTEPAARGALTVTVTATGTVEPTNVVEISSELSGTIMSVEVDFNDVVKKDQVLARLDTDKLEAQVAHSRAALLARKAKVVELKATLVEKQREYARVVPLVEKGYASQAALDVAKAAYERASASVQSAQADVALAEADLNVDETNLKKACICSPIDGVVLNRDVDPGQTVASSLQAPVLFRLADDLRKMQLEVDIDEADIGEVKEGHPARFTVEAYTDREFPARISELRYASETVEGVVTYKAVLTIDNSEILLRPGMTATAEITVREIADTLLIPNSALRYAPPADNADTSNESFLRKLLPQPPKQEEVARLEAPKSGERRIWILKDGAPEPVSVRIGVTDGLRTQVVDGGLAPGDPVIVDTVTSTGR